VREIVGTTARLHLN